VNALSPGQTFDGYLLKRQLGKGGMGIVYLAEQLKLGRDVALKVMAGDLSGDEGYKTRFEREARLAAALDHPNVVPLFEAGEADGLLYLAMRYVDGTDLAALLAKDTRVDPDFAATVISQVGAALDAAHLKGLIHRDVKPANVLLTGPHEAPHAYLTDFGIAKDSAANTALTHSGEWVGTLDYVAPEQLERRRVDARADVYSLGCMLFQMLAGRVPFDGTALQKLWSHLNDAPPSLSDVDSSLARAFDPIVARAMAKEPDDRFPSAGDLGRAIVAAAGGGRVTLPERSVATGAAASGVSDSVAPTRPVGGPVQVTPVAPERVSEAATAPLGRPRSKVRGLGVAAAVLALVAVGVIGGLVLGGSGGEDVKQVDTVVDTSGDETASETTEEAPEPKPPPAPEPVRYTSYSPSAGGWSAELPAGGDWSDPDETEETAGRRFRTTVRGSDGVFVIVDYTPLEEASFGGDPDSTREFSHPVFDSMTEYIFSNGGFPECENTTCVDYILNAASTGPGFAVLAGGGTDASLAKNIARHAADSLVPEDG
jgi:hypothetical protein